MFRYRDRFVTGWVRSGRAGLIQDGADRLYGNFYHRQGDLEGDAHPYGEEITDNLKSSTFGLRIGLILLTSLKKNKAFSSPLQGYWCS